MSTPVEQPLAVGACVQLKSGGPLMKVTAVEPTDQVTCVWHDDADQLATSSFPSACLVLLDNDRYAA